jgi:cytoskeletal protein CcmA (bactofilin family)
MFGKKAAKVTGKGSDLSAYIDEASEIEGKYTFSGTLMLNGKLTGEIWSDDTLIIGEKGVVHASVRAGVVLVSGEVRGNILGTDRVELRGSARVYGDVEAPVIVVEEGVLFEGHCRMTKGRPGEGPAVATSQPQRDLSIVSGKR